MDDSRPAFAPPAHSPPEPTPLAGPVPVRPDVGWLGSLTLVGVVLVGLGGLATPRSYALLAVAAAGSGVLLWAVLSWVRCRTELRPEGVWNRTIRSEELVPWTAVARATPAGPAGVAVRCRDGRTVRLAGALGRRARTGPSVHEIIETIRAQADLHRPADTTDRPVPDTIRRRLAWGPVRTPLGMCVGIGLLTASLAGTTLWLLPVTAVPLGLAGFLVLSTMRCHTLIGPDGIDNRGPVRRRFIPWTDVKDVIVSDSPPCYVQVVRHDGTATTLAAVRDGDPSPDGLSLDEIADEIRRRAEVEDGGEPAENVPPEPLSLRPSRLPLLWILPLATATAVAWGLLLRANAVLPIWGYLVIVPVLLFVTAVKLVTGRTEAGPDGLRNRTVTMTVDIAWREVRMFVVVPTLFGRVVQVRRTVGRGLTLAAPREGLLARGARADATLETMRALARAQGSPPPKVQILSVAGLRTTWAVLMAVAATLGVLLWQPWLDPWWPTNREATKLPRACALVDDAMRRGLIPTSDHDADTYHPYTYFVTSSCTTESRGTRVRLGLDLERRTGFDSGTERAVRKFSIKKDAASPVRSGRASSAGPVPGLGDRSWRAVSGIGDTTWVDLIVRRGNVTVDIDYAAERPAPQVAAEAEALARLTLSRLPGLG